jgi:hypothetical protein
VTGEDVRQGAIKVLGSVDGTLGKFAGWVAGFFDANDPTRSMKRLAMLMATFTLCRGTIILTKAVAHTIYQGQEVPNGTVLALAAFTVPVAGLAGVIYLFKKDGTVQSGPTTDKDTP